MKLPIIAITKKRIVATISILVLLIGASTAVLAYAHFHAEDAVEAAAPSAMVTMPDVPKIKGASDLRAATDTLDELNTINSDFQKEEDQLKQLINELQ